MTFVSFLFYILQLCGIALITVGAGFLLKYEEILDAFKEAKVNVAPIALIAIGSVILLIAFFGCCGAIRESHCMVSTVSFSVCPFSICSFVFVVVGDVECATAHTTPFFFVSIRICLDFMCYERSVFDDDDGDANNIFMNSKNASQIIITSKNHPPDVKLHTLSPLRPPLQKKINKRFNDISLLSPSPSCRWIATPFAVCHILVPFVDHSNRVQRIGVHQQRRHHSCHRPIDAKLVERQRPSSTLLGHIAVIGKWKMFLYSICFIRDEQQVLQSSSNATNVKCQFQNAFCGDKLMLFDLVFFLLLLLLV